MNVGSVEERKAVVPPIKDRQAWLAQRDVQEHHHRFHTHETYKNRSRGEHLEDISSALPKRFFMKWAESCPNLSRRNMSDLMGFPRF